jgi:hypothetical protein
MDPNFLGGAPLWKAAHARLMTGDVSGADAIANNYFGLLDKRKDPLLEYRRTVWDHKAGRRSRALEFVPSDPAAPLIHVQRAIWLLDAGNLSKAREEAQRAITNPVPLQNQALAMLALFLTQPPASAAEWKSRAAQTFPKAAEDPVQRLATAYALVLGRHFAEAVPLLAEAANNVLPPANGTLQFLLGWALVETGKTGDAQTYLATYPVPQHGVDIFAELATPRILRLQATVLEQQGKPAEAARKLEIFKKLKG